MLGDMAEFEAKGALQFAVDRIQEFGPVWEWSMGRNRVVDVIDFDTIRGLMALDGKVLANERSESFRAMLGDSTAEAMENPAARMAQRKFLAPGFTERATAAYIGEVVDIVREQLDTWAAAGSVDLATQAKALSFEFSTRLLVKFRVEQGSQKDELRALFDDVFRALVGPAIRESGSRFMRGVEARAKLLGIISQLVRTTPQLMAAIDKAKSGAGAVKGAAASNSVFDTVLLARQELARSEDAEFELSVEDVAAAGIGLIIAGNDTSGLGITGLLGLLPMFPQVLARVRQEQQQVMAAHGPELSRAALEAMPYTEAVVKEVLRLLPPARAVFRRTTVDLEVAGHFIPAGTMLHLNFLVAQLLTDPGLRASGTLTAEQLAAVEGLPMHTSRHSLQEEFNPERWLLEKAGAAGRAQQAPTDSAGASSAAPVGCPMHAAEDARGSGSWAGLVDYDAKPSGLLTFGAGPHVCLGMGLFYLEAKVLLALLAREYEVALADGSAAFSYAFFPELKQETLLHISKRPAA